MEVLDVYKNFINENLSEDEILSVIDEAEEGKPAPDGKPADRYPLDTLMKKDADKMIDKKEEVEKKLKDGTFTPKDGQDLADYILFVKTSIKIPKEKRQELYKQLKEIDREKDEARKSRLSKKIAFDSIKLIDEFRSQFDIEVKQRKILTNEKGEKVVIPTKGKNDQLFVKKDIASSLVPNIKALEGKVSDIKKIFSDLEYANSGKSPLTAPMVNVKKFDDLNAVADYMALIYSKKYMDEFFGNHPSEYVKMYQETQDLIKKAREQKKKPEDYLNNDQWVSVFLRKLKDHVAKVSKLSPKEIENIILAVEDGNVEGLKLAGKFIMTQIDKLVSHGRAAPISK